MVGVDFEDALGLGEAVAVAHFGEEALEVGADVAVAAHEAGRGGGKASGEAHGFDVVGKGGLELLQEGVEILFLALEFFAFFLLFLFASEFYLAATDEGDFFALDFGDL